MKGFCSSCRREGWVSRYRLWRVGLRWLDRDCAGRLSAMGMRIDEVTDADPRQVAEPVVTERRSSVRRMILAWRAEQAA